MTAEGSYDVIVIGAGPAGVAAAIAAAGRGASVLILDEGQAPGGQIYRNAGRASGRLLRILGKDYAKGATLADALRACGAEYRPGSTVWNVERDGRVDFLADGASHVAHGRKIVVATGAIERPFPVDGWDLPGVLTVGAAQTLLKASSMVARGSVLVGSGPLLWLLADQYRRAGHPPLAIVDTTPAGRLRSLLHALPRFLVSPYASKGLGLLWRVRRSVPVHSGVESVRIAAEQDGFTVSFRRETAERTIRADHVLVHQGVVPNINLPNALGCELAWNEDQACWDVVADEWGHTSLANVWIAGDGASVGGAEAAAARGTLAGLSCLHTLGMIDADARDDAAAAPRRILQRYRSGRIMLDRLYRPDGHLVAGAPSAIACRCEDITVQTVRTACAELQPAGLNQMKALVRCGMGPCQGRFCGSTVAAVIAQCKGIQAGDIAPYRHRFPVKPVTVADLATLDHSITDRQAVARD